MNEKKFAVTITYLKIVTVFAMIMCLVLMFYQDFDPLREKGLGGMIMKDLYGTTQMPDLAGPAFVFAFLLFDLLSVLSLAALYLVVHFALGNKEKWAYYYLMLIGVGWPVGAGLVALYCGTPAYFVSVGLMVVLFLPPVIVLRKYIK